MNFKLTAYFIVTLSANAQQYLTREGLLSFDAGSPLKTSMQSATTAVYDAEDNKLGVQVLMTTFEFKRALMQEHFNENYMESEIYPKAIFKGKYEDGRAIGTLNIHGLPKMLMYLLL